LHDTPDRSLLREEERLVSAGCVRLEDAPRLARWLMGTAPRARGTAPEQQLSLPEPVPVYITYLTAAPEPQGVALRPTSIIATRRSWPRSTAASRAGAGSARHGHRNAARIAPGGVFVYPSALAAFAAARRIIGLLLILLLRRTRIILAFAGVTVDASVIIGVSPQSPRHAADHRAGNRAFERAEAGRRAKPGAADTAKRRTALPRVAPTLLQARPV
jgi:hypothetical protein